MQAVRARITTFSSKTTAATAAAAALNSSPHSKNDFSSSIHPWLARSFVANDSTAPPRRTGGVRMPKDERRVLVKDFVDKYRALNSGKFPTPSQAQREVGGSYYTIKKLVQELEYNSKRSSTTSKNGDVSLEDLPKEESLAPAEAPALMCSKTRAEITYSVKSLGTKHESQNLVTNNMDTDKVSSTSNSYEVKKETPDSFEMLSSEDVLSIKTTGDLSNIDEKDIHQIDLESEKASHLASDNPANYEKKASNSSGSLELNEPKLVQVGFQETFELDKLENKGISVSDLCTEDTEDSTKKAATSDGSLDLKEPQVVPKVQETYESYNIGNKEVSDLFKEDPRNTDEKSATSEGSLDFNKSKIGLGERQEAYKSEKLESPRDVSRKENEKHQSPSKPTVWGNLRSFAEGVINLWKKL